jgi:hypothetical protein
MTFRRPFRHKWFYPVVLGGLIAVGYWSSRTISINQHHNNPFGMLAIISFCSWICIQVSIMVFGAKIEVDDLGVRWKEGASAGNLRWEEISALSQEGMSVGLVERSSARSIPLPFVTRQLYQVLSSRLNRLRPEEEAILFP